MTILALGVQYGHGVGKAFLRQMVVTDNHIDALGGRILYLLYGLDSAIQSNNQLEAILCGPLDTLAGYSVTLVIPVGDIEIYPGSKAAKEGVDKRNGCGAVYIVVSVNQDFLSRDYSLAKTLYSLVHVLHKEGVV